MIGDTFGRYRIVAKLGEGGWGSVWKARDRVLGRIVALKLLHECLAGSAEARSRFIREARAASKLNHPGIATVYYVGESARQLYITSTFVEGETLARRVARGPLAIPEALRLGREACEAIGHAHQRGVLHRDISSQNIMVNVDGRAIVVDFGLAVDTRSARVTPAGSVMGTLHYMAPEVLLGNAGDHRSDIYSLGVVLYELLAGKSPHQEIRHASHVYEAVHSRPDPPSARRAGIARAVDRAVLKALEKEPAQRYQSALEFAESLDLLVRPVVPRRATPRGRPRDAPAVTPRARALTVPPIPENKSLIVFPFRDLGWFPGKSSGNDVLGPGLAAALGDSLAGYSGVRLIPPSALKASHGSNSEIARVARSLGANLALCGTVQRSGKRLRLSYSLLHVERLALIAGDTVDGTNATLFAMEDRVIGNLAAVLGLRAAVRPEARPSPRDPAAREHFLQALGYLHRHENEASVRGAIELLERLRESEGPSAATRAALGRAYLAMYRLTHERDWERRAAAACAEAVKLGPRASDVRVTLGQVHAETGRYGFAARAFRGALRSRPGDVEALLGLSKALEAQGKTDEAERACHEAIASSPGDWRCHSRLGVLEFNRGRYARAAENWVRVLELTPDNARGHSNLAAAYFRMKRYGEAVGAYRRSIEIQPTASAFSSLGTVRFFLGDYREAAAMFAKGAALRQYDPVQWGNLADAYRWIGNADGAEAAYEQAIALAREDLQVNPRNGQRWADLADWQAKRGMRKEAVRSMARALRLLPQNVDCVALAVAVYHLVGDRLKALKWLEEAVRLGFDVAEFDRNPDLAQLRQDPAYLQAVRRAQEN